MNTIALLSNPTHTHPSARPMLRAWKPAAARLEHGSATRSRFAKPSRPTCPRPSPNSFGAAARRAALQLLEVEAQKAHQEGARPKTLDALAHDPHGSHPINLPFALTVFILLMLGALVMYGGWTGSNVGAIAIGFLFTLLGAALFCGRLPHE
jgi:hypothetical protein